jgi:RimJ/RimL family protein N-acetyltransferase
MNMVTEKLYLFKHGRQTKISSVFTTVRYTLEAISDNQESDKTLITLLAEWRKKYEVWFPAIFPITFEGTKRWLKDKVIDEQDRILFMIRVHNEYIGHVGLYRFDFKQNSCEIDNIVRGSDRYPGIMEDAIKTMMRWGHAEFGVTTYMLSTTSDNSRALRLYGRLGFVEMKRIPLIRVVKCDRIEWQNAPKGYNKRIQRFDVIMKLPYENK